MILCEGGVNVTFNEGMSGHRGILFEFELVHANHSCLSATVPPVIPTSTTGTDLTTNTVVSTAEATQQGEPRTTADDLTTQTSTSPDNITNLFEVTTSETAGITDLPKISTTTDTNNSLRENHPSFFSFNCLAFFYIIYFCK